ncbi:MAG: hypothetical protein LDL41_12895 [Coleofasciculus sp. S288]|nr:hypothetical protein [Coleofasciculus sp. S288]
MSYFLRIFCQNPQSVPSNEITDFIRDGWYFDEPPNFEVQPSTEAEDETHWKCITIHYQPDKRPVRIELTLNDQLLQQEIEETIEAIRQSGQLNQQQNLVEKLAASKQIIAIENDYLGLTDAAWEMLDSLEAYLAQKLSGIIYAPDDGFYNEELQPIYKLETPIGIG